MDKVKATVVTATIGRPELLRAVRSVYNQTEKDYQHLIIVDGEQYRHRVENILTVFGSTYPKDKINVVVLPYSLGGYGGPAYSIGPAISVGKYVCNLDDDNWLEPNHLESLFDAMDANGSPAWAYTLRNIAVDGKIVCRDECESMGYLRTVWSRPKEHHIDTGAFFLPRSTAVEMAHNWQHGEATINDRLFYASLKERHPNYTCTNKYTYNYYTTLGAKVDPRYFIEGNKSVVPNIIA